MTDGRKYPFQHTCTVEDACGDEMLVLCTFDMDGPDRNAKATCISVCPVMDEPCRWPVPARAMREEFLDKVQCQAEVAWENGGYADAARYEKELGA